MKDSYIKVICYDNAKKNRYFDNELKAQQYFDLLTIKYNFKCKIEIKKTNSNSKQIKIEI